LPAEDCGSEKLLTKRHSISCRQHAPGFSQIYFVSFLGPAFIGYAGGLRRRSAADQTPVKGVNNCAHGLYRERTGGAFLFFWQPPRWYVGSAPDGITMYRGGMLVHKKTCSRLRRSIHNRHYPRRRSWILTLTKRNRSPWPTNRPRRSWLAEFLSFGAGRRFFLPDKRSNRPSPLQYQVLTAPSIVLLSLSVGLLVIIPPAFLSLNWKHSGNIV